MVLEHAVLEIAPGEEDAFEAAFARARSIIATAKGFRNLRLSKCIEQPGRYLLLVEWKSFEDHTVGFRGSPSYEEWRRILHHFYNPFPVVDHYVECKLPGLSSPADEFDTPDSLDEAP